MRMPLGAILTIEGGKSSQIHVHLECRLPRSVRQRTLVASMDKTAVGGIAPAGPDPYFCPEKTSRRRRWKWPLKMGGTGLGVALGSLEHGRSWTGANSHPHFTSRNEICLCQRRCPVAVFPARLSDQWLASPPTSSGHPPAPARVRKRSSSPCKGEISRVKWI
jgi:hypothetical protein